MSRPDSAIHVIVQEMVRPRAAGVVFSRDPVTGIKDTVIEAVAGSAENLVAGRMPPERWVRKRGEWLVTPDDPVLPPRSPQRSPTAPNGSKPPSVAASTPSGGGTAR